MRSLSLVAAALANSGCVYTATDLGFPAGASEHLIAPGYWKVCGVFASKSPECHVLHHERTGAGTGTFVGTAGVVSSYATRSLRDRTFVYQTHFRANYRTAYFYALGRLEEDGSLTLRSPDCNFSADIRGELSNRGLSLPFGIPFVPRSCAAGNATADSITSQFEVLSRHRDWKSDVERRLVPLSDAEGREAFHKEMQAAGRGSDDEAVRTLGLAEADVASMERAIDSRFMRWSASWRIDRYTESSARISDAECQGGVCDVSGRFTFARQGVSYRIGFSASIERKFPDHTVRRLCYDDTTSDAKDCVRQVFRLGVESP